MFGTLESSYYRRGVCVHYLDYRLMNVSCVRNNNI